MSKQTENYIGSQQHWEDRINDDYDYLKQMEKKMEKDIYNSLEKQNKRILTPKEKANELVTMHHNLIQDIGGELGQEILVTILAKQCALITVDEILFVLEFKLDFKMERSISYYLEVKQEIEKL